MPITVIPSLTPLSTSWMTRDLVSHVRALVNEIDNQRLQNQTIRANIKSATSHVAQLLAMHKHPEYGIAWRFNIEGGTQPPTHLGQATRDAVTGLYWCNLGTLVIPVAPVTANAQAAYPEPSDSNASINQGVIPLNLLQKIETIQASKDLATQTTPDPVWQGNIQELSIDELSALQNDYNTHWRQSICYAVHGHAIYFYFGPAIGRNSDPADNDYELPRRFTLYGYRKPILDNLLPEEDPNSSWTSLVDVPDEHIRLVQLMAQKMCLEQLNKQVAPEVSTDIAQLTQVLTGQLNQEYQMERADREKVRKGFNTR